MAPDRIIRFSGELSSDDLERFAERWREVYQRPSRHPVILPSLPRRVRLRLWLTGRVNAAAIRLIDRDHTSAAIALWRACGMWR